MLFAEGAEVAAGDATIAARDAKVDDQPFAPEQHAHAHAGGTEASPKKRKRRRGTRGKKKSGSSLHGAGLDVSSDTTSEATDRDLPGQSGQEASDGDGQDFEESVRTEGAETDETPNTKRKRKRNRRRSRKKTAKRPQVIEAETTIQPALSEEATVRPADRIILPVSGNFSFKTSLLNDRGRGVIRLRGKRETGKRWSTEIPTEMAIRMVEEGAAGIIHPGLIHKLYTKTDFRLLVLQRDDYVCRYCGKFGDTIDHVLPKSKGGLSSPSNCVCACSECNLKKADSMEFVDDDVLQQYNSRIGWEIL